MGKVLGIDYGERRIGIALSDEDQRYAFHLRTLDQADPAALSGELRALCRDEGIETIVIGLPLQPDGRKGKNALDVERFGAQLSRTLGVGIVYEDERLSSVMAQKLMTDAGRSERAMRGSLDERAAQLILQAYLDRKHGKVS
ncbi:MAG: Holliday junction resolvase RuvX [Patescibacteria group bacterium]